MSRCGWSMASASAACAVCCAAGHRCRRGGVWRFACPGDALGAVGPARRLALSGRSSAHLVAAGHVPIAVSCLGDGPAWHGRERYSAWAADWSRPACAWAASSPTGSPRYLWPTTGWTWPGFERKVAADKTTRPGRWSAPLWGTRRSLKAGAGKTTVACLVSWRQTERTSELHRAAG